MLRRFRVVLRNASEPPVCVIPSRTSARVMAQGKYLVKAMPRLTLQRLTLQ